MRGAAPIARAVLLHEAAEDCETQINSCKLTPPTLSTSLEDLSVQIQAPHQVGR